MAYCSVKADCPATGQEGELIEARVTVTNLHIYNWIFLTEIWAGAELIAEADDLIPAGTSKTYYGYFTMPGYNVTILGWVHRVSSIEPYRVEFCGADSATVVKVVALPAGEIFLTDIWWEGLGSYWEELVSGMELPPERDIYILPWWTSAEFWTGSPTVTIIGHVDLTVTYPDGSVHSLEATEFQDYEGTGHAVPFEPFISSQEGTYTVVATLSHEGQVLDTKTYDLVVALARYAGTITRKELDYQNIWQALPLYDIPVDTRTRVRIHGRNDMSTNQKMGIYWFVADPEGYVVQEHYDWETFWTGPGLEQGFVGSGFDLSKVGGYTIWVELLMNPDDPQVVDRYIGDLCTVIAVVPDPEFRNFALSEYTK